jgi:hypothetical protein
MKITFDCDQSTPSRFKLGDGWMLSLYSITSQRQVNRANDLIYAPCMFQEYIRKNTEFIVTIIRDTICATEIHSQLSERTLHDWRRYDNFEKTLCHCISHFINYNDEQSHKESLVL